MKVNYYYLMVNNMDNYDIAQMNYKKTIEEQYIPVLEKLADWINSDNDLSNWVGKVWDYNGELTVFDGRNNTSFKIFMVNDGNNNRIEITCYVGNSYITTRKYSIRSKANIKKFIKEFGEK
jgi:hypothetical protein